MPGGARPALAIDQGGVRTATVQLRFYAELGDFLSPESRGREFTHACAAGTSVKDVIEGLGVPHTEVDLVLVNGASVDFAQQLVDGDRVSVYPVFEGLDISAVTAVRPAALRVTRFAADVHLGKLAGYLRLCGFDTVYDKAWKDRDLAEVAVAEHRILLTRDRGLLKRAIVTHGYLVRSTDSRRQLAEVLGRFDLWARLRPFRLCSLCNGAVRPVAKELVAAQLPPRTAARFQEYWRCDGCGQIYWRGAHYRSLLRLFSRTGSVASGETPTSEQRDSD